MEADSSHPRSIDPKLTDQTSLLCSLYEAKIELHVVVCLLIDQWNIGDLRFTYEYSKIK